MRRNRLFLCLSLSALSLIASYASAQNAQVLDVLNRLSDANLTQRETNRAIAILCPAGGRLSARLQADCNALVGAAFGGNAAVRGAIGQLTADNAPLSANRALSQNNMGSAPGGIASLLSKTGAGSGNGLQLNWRAAMDNDIAGSWSIFATFDARSSERDASANLDGFDSDSRGFLLGIERSLTPSTRLGLALRYRDSDLDFSASSGQQETRDLGVDLLYAYQGESPWYFNALLSSDARNTDQVRLTNYVLDATTTVSQRYSADFDTSVRGASVGFGYAFARDQLSFTPYLQFERRQQEVDGYDERASDPNGNGGGWAIRAGDQSNSSTSATLGARLSYAISGANGVYLPFAELAWVNVLSQKDEATRLLFLGDISTVRELFFAANDREDDRYGIASLGMSAQFAEGWSGYLRYTRHFSEDRFAQSGFYLGMRMEF
jgi:outer membrane autotransporter protein